MVEYKELLNEEWKRTRDGILEQMPVFDLGGEKSSGLEIKIPEKKKE